MDAPSTPTSFVCSGSQTSWSPQRLFLLGWLRENAVPLADLYEGAVALTFDHPLPGRLRFISHAVREIMNRLPFIVTGLKGSGTTDFKGQMDVVERLWWDAGLGLEFPAEVTTAVAISPDLYQAIHRLVGDHVYVRRKPTDAALMLFEAIAPENQAARDSLRPVVGSWIAVRDWFMSKTHESEKSDLADDTELMGQFVLFETTLYALTRPFFETVAEIDEILDNANR